MKRVAKPAGSFNVVIEEVPIPQPRADEVRVRTELMTSHRFPYRDAAAAFDLLYNRPGEAMGSCSTGRRSEPGRPSAPAQADCRSGSPSFPACRLAQ